MLFDNDIHSGGESVYIDRVELEGFKSFARRTTVHFGPGISGVVGPNGCGKSNIVDAIKWCLGEQSAKALRGQNMGDVIFNGSATEKPADFVEVSLIFNKGKSQFKGMFAGLEEVQVTRKLNRKGQSVYLLNRSKVRLKDVQLFFMDTGLYNQRYALIEQGQIGHIIEARPSQMRLLFEEAAGISHFNERRVATETKLNSTQENLDKVQIVVDGLQRQLNTLKRQAKKAVQYQRTRSVIRQLSLSIAVSKYMEWSAERSQLAKVEKVVLAKEDELEHVNRRQWSMLTQAKQSLSAKQEQSNSMQRRLQSLTQQHTEQQTTLTFQRQKVLDLEARTATLESELEGVQSELSEIQHGQSALQDAVLVAEGLMKEASQRRSNAIDAHNSATKAIKTTDKEIEDIKTTMDKSRTRIAKINGELVAIEQRLNDMRTDEGHRNAESTRLTERALSLVHEQQVLVQSIETASQQMRAKKEKERQAKIDVQDHQQQLRVVEEGSQKLRRSLQQLQREVDTTQHLINSTQRMIDSNQGVSRNSKSVLEHPKVFGLLLSMLVVPKTVEKLLLTLLGEEAESILLDDKADIASILSLSKGRMCFVQLPPDWEAQWKKVRHNPNCLGPLSVISGPPHALFALYLVLGPFLTDATTIPKWGWRVFNTQKMECIRNGVYVVGTPSSIAGELLHRRRTLVAEQTKVQDLQKSAAREKERLSIAMSNVTTQREQLQTSKGVLETLQIEIRRVQEDKTRLERLSNGLSQDISAVKRQLQEQETAASKISTERSAKLQQQGLLRLEQAEIKRTMGEADTDLRFSQEQRTQQLKHAGQCSSRRNEADNQCSLLGERLIQTKQRRDSMAQSLQSLYRRATTKKQEIADFQKQHTELLNSNRQLAEKVLQFEADKDALQVEVDASISSMSQFMEYAEKMEIRVQQTQKEKDAITEERVAAQKELDGVRSKITILKHEVNKQFEVRLSGLMDRLEFDRQLVFSPLEGVDVLPPQTEEEANMSRALYVSLTELDSIEQREEWEQSKQSLEDGLAKFGQINFAAIEEIGPVEAEFESTSAQKVDLENSMHQIEDTIAQLNALCTERFLATVDAVGKYFQQLYPRLVGGGSSSVEMLQPDDPLNTGISIFAQPPGKKLERLSLLSGGERAMVAIALLFSLFQVKPSPVCLMDEVDAPLDEANGERFNTMLKEMSTRSQFIVITHNKKTMEVVDTVYGVTMPTPGVSQLVSVKFE